MYYEDENNLYHYSYRKGDKVENVRGMDYTEVVFAFVIHR